MRQQWRVVAGELRVAVDEAEWWGASLAVLIAAVHHPHVLATGQPGTDPAELAREVLADVAELYAAAAVVDDRVQEADPGNRPRAVMVRRDGAEVVFAPGAEVANLALCLEIFACAVLEPAAPEATTARGATAYAATAWSTDIAKASGALEGTGHGPQGRLGEARR